MKHDRRQVTIWNIGVIGLMILIVASGCGKATTTPEVSTIDTATPTTEPPATTRITIDGKADDWQSRLVVADDPAGDAEAGFLDLTHGYAFVNQDALYFLIEVVDPAATMVQFDIQFQASDQGYQISWAPGQLNGSLGGVGTITRSQFAFGPALEGRVDLRDLGSPEDLRLVGANVMGGTCCAQGEWRAVDKWQSTSTPLVNEIDPARMLSDEMQYVLARRFNLPDGWVATTLIQPPLPNLFDIVQSTSGVIYLAQWYDEAALSTFDPANGTATKIMDLPPGGVSWMTGGPDDKVILALSGEVWLISPDGSHEVWGRTGDAGPMVYMPGGRLFGVNGSGTKVVELHPDGNPTVISEGFDNINDMVATTDGTIFLNEFRTGNLIRVNTDGSQKVLAEHLISNDYIALYVDDADRLYLFSPIVKMNQVNPQSGALTRIPTSGGCNLVGSGFVVTPQRKALFVNTFSQVVELDLNTGVTRALLLNGGTMSAGMTIGPDDSLYLGAHECGDIPSRVVKILDDGSVIPVLEDLSGDIIYLNFDEQSGLYIFTRGQVFHKAAGSDQLEEVTNIPPYITSMAFMPGSNSLLFATEGGRLWEYSSDGKWKLHDMAFPEAVKEFIIDRAPDGTLYAYASESEHHASGPQVKRWLLRLDLASGTSEIIAENDHQGCCTMGNMSIDPQGNLWWLVEPENLLYRVEPDGNMTLFAQNLPQDSASAVVDTSGDIYISSIIGVIRIARELH
jgi:hypothetical protein